MKFEEAQEAVRDMGYKYMAIDEDGSIYGFETIPLYRPDSGVWYAHPGVNYERLGTEYTGSIPWGDTLRRVG